MSNLEGKFIVGSKDVEYIPPTYPIKLQIASQIAASLSVNVLEYNSLTGVNHLKITPLMIAAHAMNIAEALVLEYEQREYHKENK